MTDVLLEARGLQTYYGASHVLRGVDFVVRRGEAIGLLGRNGMGKTTLIRSLLRLTVPRAGELRVRGHDMTHAAPHVIARHGIAYVPEGRGIFPNLSVHENLTMAARPNADGQYQWTLERVLITFPRLADCLRQSGAALSGGEQQMLTIGRALLTNPDLLFLDEATEGLAPRVAAKIWKIVREIRADGIAVVIVDKNHAAVTSVADRNVILVKGSVIFEGPSAALRARPDILQKHLGV